MTPIIDISIDLETLAKGPDAVILTIGIVDSLGGALVVSPSVSQQVAEGRTVDDDTLDWWLGQNAAARGAVMGPRTSLDQARKTLTHWFASYPKGYRIWGNAPSFDCEILGHFMGAKPWPYYCERCVRTAREILGDRTQPAVAHNALDDADAQLHDVRRYRQLAHRAALVDETKAQGGES